MNIFPGLFVDFYLLLKIFQILTDLVQGEFMQLGSKESENERFAHYLTKTYRKTASLIANTTKSVRNIRKKIIRCGHSISSFKLHC